jgi:hypothetical protein
MNQSQFLGIARAIIPAIVAYLVGRGWISESAAGEIAAAVVTIISAIWSGFAHTDSAKLAEVEAMPAVKKIVIDPMAPQGEAAGEAVLDRSRPKVEMERYTASKEQKS